MTRRPTRPRAYAPDPAAPGRSCDMPGCGAPGEYRAPKSRRNLARILVVLPGACARLQRRLGLLQRHVPGEIEAQLRADTAWQRPSWPLGRLGYAAWDEDVLRDPLHLLAAGADADAAGGADPRRRPPAELREPLATLGLTWPTTLDAVKTRYKELAKRHHPDANGGDRAAEERLKTINLAYAALRSRLRNRTRGSRAAG